VKTKRILKFTHLAKEKHHFSTAIQQFGAFNHPRSMGQYGSLGINGKDVKQN
jgi:hypothetical protein